MTSGKPGHAIVASTPAPTSIDLPSLSFARQMKGIEASDPYSTNRYVLSEGKTQLKTGTAMAVAVKEATKRPSFIVIKRCIQPE